MTIKLNEGTMDYLGIIKRAFQITIKNKFLWILGFLAAFTEGGIGGFNFGSFNTSGWNNLKALWQEQNGSSSPLQNPASNLVQEKVLGNQIASQDFSAISNWVSLHLNLIIIIGIVLIVVIIVLLVVSEMSKGGLIWAVSEINKDKKTNFSESFKKGFRMFWRIFGIEIVVGLIALAVIMIYIVPAIFMVVFKLYIVAIVWALVLILPLILFFIFLRILRMYALRYIAIESAGVSDSLREAYTLFRKKLKEVLVVWLIALGLGFGIGIVIALLYLILLAVLFAIGFGLYLAAGVWGAVVCVIIFGLILLAISFVVSGFIHSFLSSYWTLAYLELRKSVSSS